MREESFGQGYNPTIVDRFGVWLSALSIRKYVKDFSQLRVGDFGCGYNATFFRGISERIQSGVLADVSLSPDFSSMKNVTTYQGNLVDSLKKVPSKSLDVIMCMSVIEHLWEPEKAMAEFHRILDDGGTCIVNVPSWAGKTFLEISAFRLGLSPKEEMDDHKMYYDKRDIWPLFVKAGFKPSQIQIKYHKFFLNTLAVAVK